MTSVILATATRVLMPLLMVFSVFALFRGHHEPGGGFIGGLVAAAAFALYALANGVEKARALLRVEPRTIIAGGLLCAAASAALSLFLGLPFMTGLWSDMVFPVFGKLGTPLIFDIGVYFVVVGMVLLIVFSLAEE